MPGLAPRERIQAVHRTRRGIHIELDCKAVLDGEIVCLDGNGRAQFYDLLRRRGAPVFYIFDLLWLDGEDLRRRPLIERKRLLRSIVPGQPSVMLYAEHIEGYGVEFFRLACERDLEGIVAKAKHAAYGEKWFKFRNPKYSQYEGRRELFESRRQATGGVTVGGLDRERHDLTRRSRKPA